jgi:hypothetical protein
VEWFQRWLKVVLFARAAAAAAAADWSDHLPQVMLGVCAAFRKNSEFSPAEAVFGSSLILPGQFVKTANSSSPSFLEELQNTIAGRSNSPSPPFLEELQNTMAGRSNSPSPNFLEEQQKTLAGRAALPGGAAEYLSRPLQFAHCRPSWRSRRIP